MVVLDVDHPDIQDFIWCKAREEEKAAALRDAGFDMSIDGEGFASIQYQNANNSVRVTDEFMERGRARRGVGADAPQRTSRVETRRRPRADEPDRRRGLALRRSGRPVRHDDQRLAHLPGVGADQRVEPVLEYMHVDDSACNLASLNLMKFRREDGTFDVERFEHAVDVVFLAQEIVVGPSSYPTEEIGQNARAFRQLGLGYANLGALLMAERPAVRLGRGPPRRRPRSPR